MKTALAVLIAAATLTLTLAARGDESSTDAAVAQTPAPTVTVAKKHRLTIWEQRYLHQSATWRHWAIATGSCESGNNPRTTTGNGFLGAFQFIPSTWWDAPLTDPPGGRYIEGWAHHLPNHMSWEAQAVVSIKLAQRDGTGHWPNCG